jgi:hypothetical protein
MKTKSIRIIILIIFTLIILLILNLCGYNTLNIPILIILNLFIIGLSVFIYKYYINNKKPMDIVYHYMKQQPTNKLELLID